MKERTIVLEDSAVAFGKNCRVYVEKAEKDL